MNLQNIRFPLIFAKLKPKPMQTNLRALSKELKNYFLDFTSETNLTSVQKTEQDNELRRVLRGKGILFGEHRNKKTDQVEYYNFNLTDYFIEDTGIIRDINSSGDFPISLYLNDQINVSYEPRNISKIREDYRRDISNAELQHLKMKSEFTFTGEVLNARYDAVSDKFHYLVTGNEESIADRDNQKLARKEGMKRGALGAFYGFVTGLIAVVGIYIFVGIYNMVSKYDMKAGFIVPVAVTLVITAVWGYISYRKKYSEIRKWK